MNAPVISVREIELQLRGRCESVVRACLPNAIKDGAYMRVGSIGGEKGQSLAVTLNGANRGMWTDFSSSTGGDMITMIELTKFGGDRGQAVAWAKSWLGIDDLDPARLATMRAESAEQDFAAEEQAAKEAEAKKRGARALWLAGKPLTGVDPASRYLANRGIDVARLGAWPGSLRYHDQVWNRDAGGKIDCMVATMVTPEGAQVAAHRTWLGRNAAGVWVKADGADLGVPRGSAKKVLGKCGGAFVPIRKGASGRSMSDLREPEAIYVTEGVEDALTVGMVKPEARVGYSLRNLGVIAFPPLIETVVIVADRDDGQREIDALEQAIARQQARGHKVQIVMPPVGVKDVNAWLLADLERAA
jgi:hypothetical protein